MKGNPKSKLFVALSSIAITIIAVLSCATFALAMPTNYANALVNYSAENVSAVCSATYQIEGNEKFDFVSEQLDKNLVLNENIDSASFAMPQNLQLFSNHKSITFEYTFANTGKNSINVCLELPKVIKNMNIVETCDEVAISQHKIIVEPGQTSTYSICVSIENLACDASFSGTFNFVLSNI